MTILVVGSGERDALIEILEAMDGLEGEVLEQYPGEIDVLVAHIHKRPDITMVVFNQYLAQFRTEENIRFFTSAAATATKHGCVVVGEANGRLESILQRAARSLDLTLTRTEYNELYVYVMKSSDGVTTTNSTSLSLLNDWFGYPLDRLASANELLAAALTAHFEMKGLSLIRISHCEPRTIGYGDYFSRQDLQKTVDIQWGDRPIDEDALLALPAQMLNAVRNSDFIGIQAPNRKIEHKNAILENASYVIGRDFKAFSATAKYTSANIHLAIGKSPVLFELLKEAKRVWLITGRDVAGALGKRIEREVLWMPIPAEHKFSDSTPVDPHFTTVFERVKQQIASDIQPGDVVLVGAGILGKVYCSLAKDQGAVALDLGSLFDAWAGLTTRGKGFDIPPL